MPSFEGNPFTQGLKISLRKTGVLEAANSKDFMILACTVLIRLKGVVTDGQKPRPWLRCAKHSAITHNKRTVIYIKMTKNVTMKKVAQSKMQAE